MKPLRILWIKVGGLWPLTSGGRLRSFHTVAELARRHRVTVITTHDPGEQDVLSAHLPEGTGVVSIPFAPVKRDSLRFLSALTGSWLSSLPVDLFKWRVPRLQAEVAGALAREDVDVCVADFLNALPNLPGRTAVPMILFEHNVEYRIWQRLARTDSRPVARLLLEIEWRKMRRYEAAACRRAGLTLAVSEADRALLAALAPQARIDAVPTGVDATYFTPNGTPESPIDIVFTGSMDWYPNEDAMVHFMEKILPAVRRELPKVRATVVGRNPGDRLRQMAIRTGVQVTGTVDDVRPFVERAAVYVVPLRVGGGTRLKIFEALAMGKAVVATSVGAEGLPLVPGRDYVLADEPEEFARAVVDLLRDPERRRALGARGRRLIEEQYTWQRIAQTFETQCREVVECG